MDQSAEDAKASSRAFHSVTPDICGDRTAINSFSLVAYLPEPLGEFIGQLRRELVSECRARAHVTLLPPRALACPAGLAVSEIRSRLQNFAPFRVEFGEVRFFPQTNVVYLSVNSGLRDLEHLHDILNCGEAGSAENFPYHPHLTLAQQLDPGAMAAAGELVSRRWQAFPFSRGFQLDALTFVQNTLDNVWLDLAEVQLGIPVAA
jgi:2'-5' RNA ligase